MDILSIKNLSKSYNWGKEYALKDVNFALKEGSICAIVGESGSGKTTLLRLIAGLERPNSGTIVVKGKEVSGMTKIVPPQKRNVGMVFQNFALFPHLTVAQNIAYGLKNKNTKKVDELLHIIELDGYGGRYPNELSGGQQQRVALARTLAVDPELLLLDEPFSSLDAELKSNLRQEVYRIVKQINISVLFITHDIQDAIAIADEIIFLKNGKIVEQGILQGLYKNTKNDYARAIFSNLVSTSKNVLAALDEDGLKK
ncbi:ABC transporter ATP-binding protein [Aureispira anguillae]|uniref:ABC transporter ATP-binding protein n=1 Tax=Aureispira anguillae TaxID=2864201 RepID=A0A916DPU8_9BACT|nr:ABC transporter ATP-binding protein [Aureispira anguillae]BDS10356.1 ABC transporter ATP-binding protein [Aureispira anguillae]